MEVNIADGETLTVPSVISGNGSLTKTGNGELILGGDNIYGGGTIVDCGTISLGTDTALGSAGNGIELNGSAAVLDLNGFSPTVGTVVLADGSIVNTGAAATLTADSYVVMNGEIDVNLAGQGGLIKGTSGTVVLSGQNVYSGLTTVCGGTLQLDLAAQSPVLTGGGADIQDGRIIFDYTGGSTPASTILSILDASYQNGPGHFASGQIYSSAADAYTGVGWKDNSSQSQVTVARALYGDADLNGMVNFADLSRVFANYGQSGKVWADGDFNYDGTVNFSDQSNVLANYGQSLSALPVRVLAIAPWATTLQSTPTPCNSLSFLAGASRAWAKTTSS